MWYSYFAVGVALVIGVVSPGAAPLILAPALLVGLVGLGIAHGACDHWVVPTTRALPSGNQPWIRYLARFLAGYLGLALLMVLGWWRWPGATVGLFFALTIWHWGTADAPADQPLGWWMAHSLLRGLLLFAVPAAAWPAATGQIIQSLLSFMGATALLGLLLAQLTPALVGLVVVGHATLWVRYGLSGQPRRWQLDAGEVTLLTALFVLLPPLLALGVYFCFWHSLQHVLRLNKVLGHAAITMATPWRLGRELWIFGQKAWPLLVVSLLAIGGLTQLLAPRLTTPETWLSLALIIASVVTLPHALLVSIVLDAPQWRRARSARRPST